MARNENIVYEVCLMSVGIKSQVLCEEVTCKKIKML